MKRSILIVDDEKDLLNSLARYLSYEYVIYTASSGSEAIQRLYEHSEIDLILSDVEMPEMDGIELLNKVKTSNKNIPFIFITGSSVVKQAVDAMRKGAYDYQTKPVDMARLETSINNAIETCNTSTSL